MRRSETEGRGSRQSDDVGEVRRRDEGVSESPRELSTSQAEQSTVERTLGTLTDALEQFRQCRTADQFGDVAVETVATALNTDIVRLRRYDPEHDELRCLAQTGRAGRLTSQRPGLALGKTLAGAAYRDGVPKDDRERETTLSSPEITGTGIHAPFGRYGVVSVAVDGVESDDNSVFAVLEHLADVFETEFDRVLSRRASEATHVTVDRSRERSRTERRISSVFCAAIEEALAAESLEGAVESVVRTLVTDRGFLTARVVEDGARGVETVAVDEGSSVSVDQEDGALFVEGSRFTTVEDAAYGARRVAAADPAIRSGGTVSDDELFSLVAPLRSNVGERDALVVTVADPSVTTPRVEATFATFAGALGRVIGTKRVADLVAADRVVELSFRVRDPSCLAVGVSRELECRCRVSQAVPRNDGRMLSYLDVDTTDREAAVATATGLDETVSATVVGTTPESTRLEVVRTGSAARELLDAGASTHEATATDGVGTLTVRAPRTAKLNELVDRYTDTADAELVTKETVSPETNFDDARSTLEDRLTPRQREVLVAAYESGYYEWPRERTAEEVAESLDISVSTLSEHLRAAHRQITTAFFESFRADHHEY